MDAAHLPTVGEQQLILPVVHDDKVSNNPLLSTLSIDNFASKEADEESCSLEPHEYNLIINDALSLKLTQAPSAFINGVGTDETGGVLWGASVCLCQYLKPAMVQGLNVMELGCGSGAPSLVSYKYGAKSVLATDFELSTLQRMEHHARLNDCDFLDIQFLDWNDSLDKNSNSNKQELTIDVLLASDVIYGTSKVAALVRTIDNFLATDGVLYYATRNGRSGVKELLDLLQDQGFEKVKEEACVNNRSARGDNIPDAFSNVKDLLRWSGKHTIYTFRRKRVLNDSS